MTEPKAPSDRSRARRMHEKAAYDRATIDAILDAMPVAHVGYVKDGAPIVIPTLQWRIGDHIYWHGSSASRTQRTAKDAQVCVTVTLTDAMVLARSGLEHSVNFRAVMVFGEARAVTNVREKAEVLKAMMEQMFPGRWDQLRPMTKQELKATAILTLPLTEASAKIGSGMPTDPPEDLGTPVWAGILPIQLTMGQPVPDPNLSPDMAVPAHVKNYHFGH
ncbi:pyridoxamine 5'-phosphate oxidase family protein [Cypionkella sp.]|uniref:pyridoxamine 5'-phosphate oxidase family protein n=1 Tax=Cypionkella sp. TaxID=2811411 RepID=UPI00271A8024|nr:pyridoxamine 5'-phosphate oxidase family protein [Cypionkella sp.]MDO8984507.1 pyridoxamine 5'-phosphate oxidase family protein [Cypionkella sp.]MDP2047483.1 pyridoxamine 5'-phosphate oxidase family protein [Cypionkella sp.]